MKARKRTLFTVGAIVVAASSSAQVPDLLNALDAGGRSMGIGGATQQTDGNTLSSYYNPAGLAYVSEATLGGATRNLPQSNTVLSGQLVNPVYSTGNEVGPRRITHLGVALPMKGGVLGLAYTMGGFFKDFRTSGALKDGSLNIVNMQETLSAQTDFFTIAWGKRQGTTNYGLGLVIANQYISDVGSYDIQDSNNQYVGTTRIGNTGNSYGVGAIAGLQMPASRDGRSVVGLSVRTPISLKNTDQTGDYLNRVPGRASIGMATRVDNMHGGSDFLVYGGQLDYFFSSDKNGAFQRKDVVCGGFGIEYDMHRFNARIPIRVGYSLVPNAGDAFGSRNTFTFGLGYRPADSNLAFDMNFGMPSGGGSLDMGLSLTYKLGK